MRHTGTLTLTTRRLVLRRLLPDDAQWVYLYLCPGTTVVITDELERDEELRARLLPKETPTPDCYMIQGEE